ncbi:MAG: M23 family metallopeptidase [Tyzzerella sp.]|nr:M23 family metallopeptidase [Tyzzerella sp.]
MKKERSAAVGLVVGFVAMIAIVGAITYSNYEGKVEDKQAKAEEESQEQNMQAENEREEESQSANTGDVQAEIEEHPEIIEPEIDIIEPSIQESPLVFSEEDVLSWPVDGNVLIPFNMEQTVYFATLDQYKYNPAVIIAGDVGEEVWAATDGKVTSIREDAQTGTTVTVDLGDGFEAIYGQLGEIHVKEGDRIDEGVLIGYLGEPTKYYSVEGCNLYFQLLKDGEAVDPLHYLDV